MAGKTAPASKSSGKTDAAGTAADVAAGALNSGLGKVANDLGFGDSYLSSNSKRAPTVAGGDVNINPSINEIARGISRNNSLVNQMVSTLDITNDLISSQVSLQRESNRYLRAIHSSLGSVSTGGGINILGGGAGTGKPQGFGGKVGAVAGSVVGGIAGGIGGSFFSPGLGTAAGGLVGSTLGESAGSWIGGKIGSLFSGSSSSEGGGSLISSITGLMDLNRPSAKADIGSKRSYSGVSGNAAANKAMNYFMSQGWSKEQAAGIVANLMVESANFDPNVINGTRRGDGGKAVGIAQWHADRQRLIYKNFGKTVEESSFEEQLAYVQWELVNSEKRAGNILKTAKSASEAAALVDQYYERSSGIHRRQRQDKAESLAGKESKPEPKASSSTGTSGATESSQKPGGLISSITGMAGAFSSAIEKISGLNRPSAGSATTSGGSSGGQAAPPVGAEAEAPSDQEYKGLTVRKKSTGLDITPRDVGRYGSQQAAPEGVANIVEYGKYLQSIGLRVSEHPAFGGVDPTVHKGRGHADGRAIDLNVGKGVVEANHPVYGPMFDRIAQEAVKAGFKVIWRSKGHEDHMHIEEPAGAAVPGRGTMGGYSGDMASGERGMFGRSMGRMMGGPMGMGMGRGQVNPLQAIGGMLGGRFGGPIGAMLGAAAGAALSSAASSLFGGASDSQAQMTPIRPEAQTINQPSVSPQTAAPSSPMQQFNQMFGGADYSGTSSAAFFAADKAAISSPAIAPPQVSAPLPPPRPVDISKAPPPPLPPPRPPEFSMPQMAPQQPISGDFGRNYEMDRYADVYPSTSMPSDITTAIAGMFNYNKKGDPTIAGIHNNQNA